MVSTNPKKLGLKVSIFGLVLAFIGSTAASHHSRVLSELYKQSQRPRPVVLVLDNDGLNHDHRHRAPSREDSYNKKSAPYSYLQKLLEGSSYVPNAYNNHRSRLSNKRYKNRHGNKYNDRDDYDRRDKSRNDRDRYDYDDDVDSDVENRYDTNRYRENNRYGSRDRNANRYNQNRNDRYREERNRHHQVDDRKDRYRNRDRLDRNRNYRERTWLRTGEGEAKPDTQQVSKDVQKAVGPAQAQVPIVKSLLRSLNCEARDECEDGCDGSGDCEDECQQKYDCGNEEPEEETCTKKNQCEGSTVGELLVTEKPGCKRC